MQFNVERSFSAYRTWEISITPDPLQQDAEELKDAIMSALVKETWARDFVVGDTTYHVSAEYKWDSDHDYESDTWDVNEEDDHGDDEESEIAA
jgi:hypothetical protein